MNNILAIIFAVLAALFSHLELPTFAQISAVVGVVFLLIALATSVKAGGRDE